MAMRPVRLPGDFLSLLDMLPRTFQYPENPEWSFREDEKEDIVQTIRTFRRLWPIIRLLQLFSPVLRDMFRGYVWEEGDEIAGVVLVQRQGTAASWYVGVVGVVPEHRGRGIARRLLKRSLDDLRRRGADKAYIDVIDRNVDCNISIGNAEDHFAGGEEAYAKEEWKKAYDLYRKAYRDVVTGGGYEEPLP